MEEVGVEKLRLELAEYLKRVRQGEQITVTEQGKPVAQLLPVNQQNDHIREKLTELAEKGSIIMPGYLVKPPKPLKRKRLKGAPIAEAVIEERRCFFLSRDQRSLSASVGFFLSSLANAFSLFRYGGIATSLISNPP